MLDSMDSQDDRRARRLARRWQRRTRIAAPFLVVPAMLGLLVLSVDLIEYRPSREAERASAPARPARAQSPAPTPDADGLSRPMAHAPEAALSVSVVGDPIASAQPTPPPAASSPGLPAWMVDASKTAEPR
ncbi:MAG: hypothetical protein R3F21_18995 [Myxococcota bacterium]